MCYCIAVMAFIVVLVHYTNLQLQLLTLCVIKELISNKAFIKYLSIK